MTEAYRNGSDDAFHHFVQIYHTDFMNWKLQWISENKLQLMRDNFKPINEQQLALKNQRQSGGGRRLQLQSSAILDGIYESFSKFHHLYPKDKVALFKSWQEEERTLSKM